MRFKHFKPRTLTEADLQQLDELRMGPSNLQQFAQSPEAEGIMAGFEAELVFRGLGGSDDDLDMEPDYDADERARSIQQVIEFFENDEWGYGLDNRAAGRLQDKLDERYYDWQDEQMYEAFRDEAEELVKKAIEEDDFDWDDEIRKQLNMMDLSDDEIEEAMKQGGAAPIFTRLSDQEEYAQANPGYQRYSEAREQAEGLLDDLVQDSISSQDKHYDYALDEFRDGFYIDDDTGFFSETGLNYMSDIAEEYDLSWPVYTGAGGQQGGFDESNAERLADDLSERLGIKTKVSSGYHSAKRDAVTWIFEPDSSLEADDQEDMPVEIVSPPMPLEQCLKMMKDFFTWAQDNGAYANQSTGFHMGVSLPGKGGDVDYVKLALFLGDEHVLESFGRAGNTYAEAAMRKIKKRVQGSPDAVKGALDLMRHNLIELAQKALEISNAGFGKYTSINPQGATTGPDPSKRKGAKYIEFRSAGGVDESGNMYFEDMGKLQNTLLRYAQAMHVASRPDLERREYYKKLYKLISPPEGDPAIDLFARYTSGAIDANTLKSMWAEKQLDKEPKGDWKLWNATNGVAVPGHEYHGYTKSNAWEKAKKSIQPGSSMEDFQRAYKLLPTKSQTGDWEVYNTQTGETLETLHGFATKGEAADSVYDKYSQQGIGFNLRPADPDEPEKELTRRQKLAKRIKEPKVQTEPESGPAAVPRKWEFYYEPTGRILDTVDNASQSQAKAVLGDVQRRYNDLPADSIRMRTVPTSDSEQRYNDRRELEPVVDQFDQPPQGFITQRPITGDYYEVKSGDRVYGYLPTSASGSSNITYGAKLYVNQLTGRDDAQLVYRAGEPTQARTTNGVPIWELYDKFSDSSLYTIINNTSEDALKAGIRWLRDHGAEDPSTWTTRFGVRPKMSA